MKSPGLQSFRLKNFKAIRDSKTVQLSPLTVFIGDNGSGKSSIIEGLEFLYSLVTQGLDSSVEEWRGLDQIINKSVPHTFDALERPTKKSELLSRPYLTNPLSLELQSKLENRTNIKYNIDITAGKDWGPIFIQKENLIQQGGIMPSFIFSRDDKGGVIIQYILDAEQILMQTILVEGTSLVNLSASGFPYEIPFKDFVQDWQFVSLNPGVMRYETPRTRTAGQVRLAKDGSNIAEYLLNIQNISPQTFDSIVEALRYVLPYSHDLQVALTSELERTVYLQLNEGNFKVPGWLLSTGTLRIVALLALLRHPEPPPLIIIEEIENGLDPRSIHLVIDEIRSIIDEGKTQIIFTTHSPYLLDLIPLPYIILVERIDGQPTFTRPADSDSLQEWAKRFGSGQLYTMDKLRSEGHK